MRGRSPSLAASITRNFRVERASAAPCHEHAIFSYACAGLEADPNLERRILNFESDKQDGRHTT